MTHYALYQRSGMATAMIFSIYYIAFLEASIIDQH